MRNEECWVGFAHTRRIMNHEEPLNKKGRRLYVRIFGSASSDLADARPPSTQGEGHLHRRRNHVCSVGNDALVVPHGDSREHKNGCIMRLRRVDCYNL